MGTIKNINTFQEGMDYDTSLSRLPNKRSRRSVNMEILKDGDFYSIRNMRGTKNISTYLSTNTDIQSLNVLGVFEVSCLYDRDCDGNFESEEYSIVIFKYDNVNKSEIIIVSTETEDKFLVYPNINDNTDLNFPPTGTISASYTKERGIPEIYWDDHNNEMRKITLKISCQSPSILPSARDLTVRRRIGGVVLDILSIDTGGNLIGGSYQIAYRLFNTKKCTSSDWSLFTNPIPVMRGDCSLLPYDEQLGASVGIVTDKKITLSVPMSSEFAFYDAIQIAIIKNIDGLTIPSDIAYISEPSQDWYNNKLIVYDGTIPETQTITSEINTEDAAIQSAKSQLIKDNILFRANIKYIDYKNDRGSIQITDAKTIKKEVDYKCEIQTPESRGHFRTECYAYAIAYYDEFFNFGLIEPLDFSTHTKDKVIGTFIATAVINIAPNQYTIFTTGNPSLQLGDVVKNGSNMQVIASTLTSINVKSSIFPSTGTYDILLGQKGNQSPFWSWKYPDRCDSQFSILSDNDIPYAIGLELEVSNHPTWAKGAVILRQKRKENILFQTPHIPCIGVRGVPTQGVGAITYSPTNTDDVDLSKADYEKQYDFICPKIFGLGHAKNIGVLQNNLYTQTSGLGTNEAYYSVFYPYYQNQDNNYNDITHIYYGEDGNGGSTGFLPNSPLFNAEIPNYIVAIPPEYVFNRNGEPTYPINLLGKESIRIVDAVMLKRKILQEDVDKIEIANKYSALTHQQYFYNTPYVLKDYTLGSQYNDYFVKLQDLITGITNVKAEKQYLITLSSSDFLLSPKPFSGKSLGHIELYGAYEKLAQQQNSSNAVPGGTNYFNGLQQTQRQVLIRTSEKMLDLTKFVYDGIYSGNNILLFPQLSVPTIKIYDTAHLTENIGKIDVSGVGLGFDMNDFPLDTGTVFVDDNDFEGATYILNIEKGLSDNRYNKLSTDWYFTGAYFELTPTEVANNTPKRLEVWGGDCFVTKYAVKINNNSPRVSDIYENIHAEADDYISYEGSGNPPMEFKHCVKTGIFKNNVEFLELFIESKINTLYHEELSEFPAYIGTQIGEYTKPYFYQYNGGYSVENSTKVFSTTNDQCEQKHLNNNHYPARIVWSDKRLYQADGTGIIDVDGFSKFRVLNRFDLDEQYGGITSIIDFGDDGLHSIQETKVRFDPVGRDIAETADGNALVLGADAVIGKGGYYLGYDNGSKHMRTIKKHNGVCFFIDEKKKEVCMFGSRGSAFNIISNKDAITFFNKFLKDRIQEHNLIGIIDPDINSNDYWVINNQTNEAIIYSLSLDRWMSEIDFPRIYNGTYAGKSLYLLGNNVHKAYHGITGNYLDEFRDSKFSLCANGNPDIMKVFNTQNFEMEGGFLINKDIIKINGKPVSPNDIVYNPNLLLHTSYIQPSPLLSKNGQYWLNRIRNENKTRVKSAWVLFEYTIKNDGRDISIQSIYTDAELSYNNRG